MKSGRMTLSVVSRLTGVCSTRSTYFAFPRLQLLILYHSKTLKGITIPDCPT